MKEARGKPNGGRMASIPDVETLPCPSGFPVHVLSNYDEGGRVETRCIGCSETWADLDKEVRRAIL